MGFFKHKRAKGFDSRSVEDTFFLSLLYVLIGMAVVCLLSLLYLLPEILEQSGD